MNSHSFNKLFEKQLLANGLSYCTEFCHGTSKPTDNNQTEIPCFQKNPSLFSTNVVGQPS